MEKQDPALCYLALGVAALFVGASLAAALNNIAPLFLGFAASAGTSYRSIWLTASNSKGW